jgi:hypothetical protein
MPIAGVNTWLPTIDEFVTHWTAVNAFLAPGAFTLSGGYALTSLQTDRTAVDTAISNVEGLNNLLNTARGDRDIRRAAMLPRLVQFNSAVRGQLPGSRYIKSLSKLPNRRRVHTSLGLGGQLRDLGLHGRQHGARCFVHGR